MLKGKTVVLGVTGSIAAYKIANLASMLSKLHADIHVLMTQNATNFINPITFETLTGNKCLIDTFDRNFQFNVEHVSLAKKADVVLIAPASANVIGKLANGIADDMLTTTVMACKCKKIISPAMNTNMYENPIVQDNIAKLKRFGMQVIEPDVGLLACKDVGAGKMPSEDTLLDFTGIEMESTEPVESILPVMHKLEKVDMSDCGFSDEEMDALNKKYENVRFVWTLHITHYNIRTDTTYFRASSRYYGYFTNETIKKLAYCPDMIALDLGHRPIEDLSFLYQMPDLKYLVLLDCHALDLSPIASCDNLIWLELNRAYATSIAPLKDCKSLRDLNITFMTLLQPEDTFQTLMEMDKIERVWFSYGVLTQEEQEKLQEAHPDIVYHGVYDWVQSNEDPWRCDQDYYDMRDALGHMFYMNGTGIIHCKIIDGVRYPLDPEFEATMDWGEHDRDR